MALDRVNSDLNRVRRKTKRKRTKLYRAQKSFLLEVERKPGLSYRRTKRSYYFKYTRDLRRSLWRLSSSLSPEVLGNLSVRRIRYISHILCGMSLTLIDYQSQWVMHWLSSSINTSLLLKRSGYRVRLSSDCVPYKFEDSVMVPIGVQYRLKPPTP